MIKYFKSDQILRNILMDDKMKQYSDYLELVLGWTMGT